MASQQSGNHPYHKSKAPFQIDVSDAAISLEKSLHILLPGSRVQPPNEYAAATHVCLSQISYKGGKGRALGRKPQVRQAKSLIKPQQQHCASPAQATKPQRPLYPRLRRRTTPRLCRSLESLTSAAPPRRSAQWPRAEPSQERPALSQCEATSAFGPRPLDAGRRSSHVTRGPQRSATACACAPSREEAAAAAISLKQNGGGSRARSNQDGGSGHRAPPSRRGGPGPTPAPPQTTQRQSSRSSSSPPHPEAPRSSPGPRRPSRTWAAPVCVRAEARRARQALRASPKQPSNLPRRRLAPN